MLTGMMCLCNGVDEGGLISASQHMMPSVAQLERVIRVNFKDLNSVRVCTFQQVHDAVSHDKCGLRLVADLVVCC
jgi:hypothetical protein